MVDRSTTVRLEPALDGEDEAFLVAETRLPFEVAHPRFEAFENWWIETARGEAASTLATMLQFQPATSK